MKRFFTPSLCALYVCIAFIVGFRSVHIHKGEIAWDVLGYYLPLASTFVHDDPALTNYDWLKQLNEKENLSGTLYQVSTNENGEPMYFFLFGWSICYSPWFFAAHSLAAPLGYPADGFSLPYQYALVIGAMLYTIIGLIYFRKVLRTFFSERITALVLIITAFATNYCHHLTIDDLGTVNLLFMFMSLLLWHTVQWHKKGKGKNLIAMAVTITLMALIKPSEVLALLIPLFWKGEAVNTWKQKWQLIGSSRKALIAAIVICLALAMPQMVYWYHKTGQLIYDSYKNPGVGLDFLSPHLADVLFSYRKGWLLYTPIMLFALIGFWFLYRNNKRLFVPLFIYFIVAFYIIASWTEWWYGAAFSTRPLITTYPVLGIALGFFITQLFQWKLIWRSVTFCTMAFFLFLNQFQWWQLRNYVLDPYRTTKAYYWSTFLRTQVTPEQRKLLLVSRDFSGDNVFQEENYNLTKTFTDDFSQPKEKDKIRVDSSGNSFLQLHTGDEFGMTRKWKYNELTSSDHIWVEVGFDVRFDSTVQMNQYPLLTTTMDHKGTYGYQTIEVRCDTCGLEWFHFSSRYMTPEIRSKKDHFQLYIWNRDKVSMQLDNLVVKIYEQND